MLGWKGGHHWKDGNEEDQKYGYASIFGKKPCCRFIKGNTSESISDKAEYILTRVYGLNWASSECKEVILDVKRN